MIEGRKLQVGGALRPQRDIYIERPEDRAFFDLLLSGEYVNVLSPRQMGKSSLMVRTIRKLRANGVRTPNLDVAADLAGTDQADKWFLALVREITRKLEIQFDVSTWWREHEDDALGQRLRRFFREVLLEQVPAPTRIVVFFDEIDNTLSYPFTDSLFTAIRGMYNERSLDSNYERIAFCLIGVATPDELIKDRRSTSYNVGRTLALRDFDLSRDDLRPLVDALSPDLAVGQLLLDRVIYWTGGQPLLTIKFCAALAEVQARTIADVDNHIHHSFNSLNEVRTDIHIQQILRFVEMRFSSPSASLKLYGKALRGAKVKAETTLPHLQLELSGLVKRDDAGNFVVRNRLYAQLFDADWLKSTRAMRVANRYKAIALVASVLAVLALGLLGYSSYRSYQYWKAMNQYSAAIKHIAGLVDLSGNGATGYTLSFGNTDGSRTSKADPSKSDQEVFNSVFEAFPNKDNVAKSVFEAFPNTDNIDKIHLIGQKIQDLSKIALLKNLSTLWLIRVSATDLSPLSKLEKLDTLRVDSTGVTDISPLSGLINLRFLSAVNNKISDISPLQNLTNLESLYLTGNSVKSISALSKLTKLKYLYLDDDGIDDLSPLAELQSLDTLQLTGKNDDLSPIRLLSKLRVLSVSGLKSDNIPIFQDIKSLRSVKLPGAVINDWSALSNFSSLIDLDVSRSNILKLDSLCPNDTLEFLDLTDTGVSDLAPIEKCSNLTIIDLSGTPVTDLRPLRGLQKLKDVGVADTKINDADIDAFKASSSSPNVQLEIARKSVLQKQLERMFRLN
jgi:Leucine-rich repeat (LRR) protein